MWTVQEFVLARRVIFRLGSREISLDWLESTVRDLKGLNPSHSNGSVAKMQLIWALFDHRHRAHLHAAGELGAQKSLSGCFLDLARHRQCKDDRDRIYSMLGIAPDIGITPDYSLSLRQVYANFTAAALSSGDFLLLHACCFNEPGSRLPKYVPSLNSSNSEYFPLWRYPGRQFRAASHCQPRIETTSKDQITISGIRIGTLEASLDLTRNFRTFADLYRYILTYLITDPREVSEYLHDLHTSTPHPRYRRSPYLHTSLFDVLARTLSLDTTPSLEHIEDIHTNLDYTFTKHLRTRTLFWTEQGYIGLGPSHLTPGDEVVVFHGDYTPFLLRKQVREQLTGSPNPVLELVGDCYVHGWMYGYFPDDTVQQPKSIWRESLGESAYGALVKMKRFWAGKMELEAEPCLFESSFTIG